MPTPTRSWLSGLTVGLLLAAGLVALMSPGLPALAQSGRAGALAPPPEPYFGRGVLATGTGGEVFLSPPVPAGKLLVVESIFATLLVPTGQRPQLHVGADNQQVFIPLISQGANGAVEFFGSASPAVRLYIPSGPVSVLASTTSGGSISAGVDVVGHLVAAPAP